MFEYEFPCGKFNTLTIISEDGQISFDPPVYEQRYSAVTGIMNDKRWAKDLKKVAEFGCADMKLLPLLKRNPNIEHILQIDVDKYLLKEYQYRSEPGASDYLKTRDLPLHIDLLQGNIEYVDETLQGVDMIIGLEIIEHLHDDVLKIIPNNIFGKVKPKLVILSTPNVEFNVLFKQLNEKGFRHFDHKFEWTRAEFQAWCLEVTKNYPNYQVAFKGVGAPPPGKEALGNVTQIGLFVRNDLMGLPLRPMEDEELPTVLDEANKYKLVHRTDFPDRKDNRTVRERVKDEIHYFLFNAMLVQGYLCNDDNLYKVPLEDIVNCLERFGGTEAMIRELLEEMPEFEFKNDFVLIENQTREYHSSHEDVNICVDRMTSESEYSERNEYENRESEESWD